MPPDDARHRTFICRDDLWAACERLAWQQGRAVDEVIGDALSRYVRGPASITPPPAGGMAVAPTMLAQQHGRASGYPTNRPPGGHAGPPPLPPTLTSSPYPPPQAPRGFPPPQPPNYPGGGGGGYGQQHGSGYPPTGGSYGPPGGYPPPQGFGQTAAMTATPSPHGAPHMPGPGPGAAEGPPTYPIFLYYQGDRVEIMQPRFVLGRSRNASDYAINDSNVSRQHAAVEWLRGHYHIVDLGSTNGIQFNGRRVERKVIYDGDVITIAGHQLRFGRQ